MKEYFSAPTVVSETTARAANTMVADRLRQAADHAQSLKVTIAIEPHDSFVRSSSIAPLLRRIKHSALRVIWDIGNSYAYGDDPEESFQWLRGRIAYVQVKDGRGRGSSWQLAAVGDGDVPLEKAIDLLLKDGYPGAFSIEWERAWHAELDTADVALPAALAYMHKLLAIVRQNLPANRSISASKWITKRTIR